MPAAMAVWYIKKLDSATGPHILRIQHRNFPSRAGGAASTMRPIVTSVNASTNRATRNSVPTIPPLIPSTLV